MNIIANKPDLLAVIRKTVNPEAKYGRSICCPFHREKTPSLHIFENQSWYCFGCGKGGDVYDFIGFLKFGESWDKKNREMFKDVKRSAESGASGYFRTGSSQIREKDVSDETKEAFKLAAAVYQRTLISGRNEEASAARNYLYGRGFTESTIRDLKIGYAGRSELHKNGLSLRPAERTGYIERMRKAGFIRDGREYFTNRIIFPNITKDGRVLNLTGRAVGNSARRYLNIPNVKKNLYLLELADPGEELYLTESVPDAVTLYQLGYSAAAANGTALSGQMKAALDAYGQIIIVPQNDAASMNAACRWCEAIPRCRILLPEYMDGKEKDINDILRLEGEQQCSMKLSAAAKKLMDCSSYVRAVENKYLS